MLAFFRCVAEAVVENGLHGLADMVPGGAFACAVAAAAWKKYGERKKNEEIRDEIRQIAEACFEDARQVAIETVNHAAPPGASVEDRLNLELYLSQVPSAVRASLKRPEDSTGKTLPPAFRLNSADDMLRLLPARPPRFKPNDPIPGLSEWSLVEPLGAGGFGEVWLARHRSMSSLCGAVKFCHGQQARDLKHESGLIDRVMSAGKHPNIVPLMNASLEGETPWLLYEYVPGGDVGERILEWQLLPAQDRLPRATAALRELAAAVGHFHKLPTPVVHRDLKPANVLFDRATEKLRITDFGIGSVLAKAALAEERHGTLTLAGRLATSLRGSHTPLYASPQQRDGADPRDDVHALGIIGYQMLTGHLNQGAGPDFADDLREHGTPEDLIALLGRCVAQKAERRPANANELQESLSRLSRQATAPPELPSQGLSPPTAAMAPVREPATLRQEEIIVQQPRSATPLDFGPNATAFTLEEMVSLCDVYWAEAEQRLKLGHLELWLTGIGHSELAEVARGLRLSGLPSDRCLVGFLARCGSTGANVVSRRHAAGLLSTANPQQAREPEMHRTNEVVQPRASFSAKEHVSLPTSVARCPSCDFADQWHDDIRRCGHCGYARTQVGSQTDSHATPHRDPTPQRAPSSEERRAAAVGEMVLGLVLAAVGYFFLWGFPFGKLLVMGGVMTAANAGRKF